MKYKNFIYVVEIRDHPKSNVWFPAPARGAFKVFYETRGDAIHAKNSSLVWSINKRVRKYVRQEWGKK